MPALGDLEKGYQQQSALPDLNALEKGFQATQPVPDAKQSLGDIMADVGKYGPGMLGSGVGLAMGAARALAPAKQVGSTTYGLDDVLLHGVTLGVNEKAGAALTALRGTGGTFSQRYLDALNDRMQARGAEKQALGVPGSVAEAGAGMLPFAATGGAMAPASYLGKLGLAVGSASASAGVQGAAEAKPGEELPEAIKNATLAGLTAAFIPSPSGGLVARTAQRALLGGLAGAGIGATLSDDKTLGAAAGGVLGAATGGMIPLTGAVAKRVAEAIPAVGRLADAFSKAGIPTPVLGQQGKAEQIVKDYPGFAGKFAQIADRASQAADQSEAATLAQMGDRDVLEHMTTQLAQKSPVVRQGLIDFAEGQQARATPLYAKAYEQSLHVTSKITDALDDPTIQKALDGAVTELKRAKVPLPPAPDDRMVTLGKFVAGRIQAGGAPPVPGSEADHALSAYAAAQQNEGSIPIRVLDRAKQILDKTIWKSATDTDMLLRNRTTQHWLGTLLQEADQQVPEYGQARAIAATYKGVVQAANDAGKMASARAVLGPTGRAAGDITNPTGFEVASGLMGRLYGPAHYAIRSILAEGPSMKRYGAPLTKMLLTGSGGQFLGEDLGGAGELAQMIEKMAQPQGPARVGGALTGALSSAIGSSLVPERNSEGR